MRKDGSCSRCQALHDLAGSYCRKCHAANMRAHRAKHGLPASQKLKDAARNYARKYVKWGYLKRQPCGDCGTDRAQIHHEDYAKPLEISWLCRSCHMKRHGVTLPLSSPDLVALSR